MDIFPLTSQRPAILALLDALDASSKTLRRDECGNWRIKGSHGHVCAVPEGYQLLAVGAETANWWNICKRELGAFTTVTQDGDAEGALILDRLPTAAEAEIIRRRIGIRRRRHLSEETLAELRTRASELNGPTGEKTATEEVG
jgi:hypothetical protein